MDRTSDTRRATAQTLNSLSLVQSVGNGCGPSPSGRSSVGFPRKNAFSNRFEAAKYGNGYDSKALITSDMLVINLNPFVGKLFVMTSCV